MSLIVAGLALFLAAPAAEAAIFNPHYILSDREMRDADSMSFSEILAFLNDKGGFNFCFDIDPADGLLKSTAQLVDDAAKRYSINPKYILALIQKESGIVETTKPTQRQMDWATGYALCDGCSRTAPLAQKYKGLAKQIDAGAGWMDEYLDGMAWSMNKLQPGGSITDRRTKTKITPVNLATAALYSYTPNLQGNRLLWSIWQRWFDNDLGLKLPDGSLVRNEKTGAVALIQNGKLRPIVSAAVLASRFGGRSIIDLNQYDFKGLEETIMGAPVRFADLSLVGTGDGTAWLLVGEKRRRIATPEAFAKIGFNPEEVEEATLAEISDYAEGEPLTEDAVAYPTGQLVQDKTTGGVYWAEAGAKHPIWDKSVLTANFSGRKIKPLPPADLETLVTADPVRLADGILIRLADDPGVFVISNGDRRPIVSEEAFIAFGYEWKNVLITTRRVLELHPLGEPVTVEEPAVGGAE